MKRGLIILLALLLCTAAAQAEDEKEAMDFAKSSLTEVYGYRAAELDQFIFETEKNENGGGIIRYYHQAYPQFVYTLSYSENPGYQTESPFGSNGYSSYPGEGAIREVLSQARENSWFSVWDADAMLALAAAMQQEGMHMNAEMEAGLSLGILSPARAVDAFFASCYGDSDGWNPQVIAWRDLTLQENGLTAEASNFPPAGVTHYTALQLDTQAAKTVTLFRGEAPADLQSALTHPLLEGWQVISGAAKTGSLRYEQGQKTAYSLCLSVLDRDDERLLLLLVQREGEDWQLYPVSADALYPGEDPVISTDSASSGFTLFYQRPNGIRETYTLYPTMLSTGWLCSLNSYKIYDPAAQQGYQFTDRGSVTSVWCLTSDGAEEKQQILQTSFMGYLDHQSLAELPKTLEEAQTMVGRDLPPEGISMAQGVHFRASTSSRSKDLGLLHAGVLFRVKAVVDGDPNPWLQTQIGTKKGYICAEYTYYAETLDRSASASSYLTAAPLTVAMVNQETALKKGTGLFAGTVQALPAGTKMHVICQEGSWLYVVVPQADIDWYMDIDGVYGYIKADSVSCYATPLHAQWAATAQP